MLWGGKFGEESLGRKVYSEGRIYSGEESLGRKVYSEGRICSGEESLLGGGELEFALE
ncbi:MAG: hypothetical protein KBC30_09695 [Planctomycetes bacterium]|nr:hypothetical protein [Planctomycetota bacterium]HPY76037.1 hypothetical protein [Planctomycetota bacterium]HQB01575.1 hypothetical protein [Planctomycetota bacterium]